MTCNYYRPGETPICERSETDRFYIINDCEGKEVEDGVYCNRSDALKVSFRSRIRRSDPRPVKTVDHLMGVERESVPEIILRTEDKNML